MKRVLLWSFFCALTLSAHATNITAKAVRKTVEASMQVTGEITIAPDGSVKSYHIEKYEALPADVKRLLDLYVPKWSFVPIVRKGQPVTMQAKMGIQVVARPAKEGAGVEVLIRDTVFEDPNAPVTVVARKLAPPTYPMDAAGAGVSGTVYVVLRLNPDGTVAEVHAEQVNMTVVASENELRQWRDRLAKVAVNKAKRWTFEVLPGQLAKRGPISVRVPVDFTLSRADSVKYGKWQAYVPGPYAPIPWDQERTASTGVGAMTPGRLYSLDSPIKLVSPSTGS